MNIKILQTPSTRPLCIDFDQYTDGDADFKKELIYLMIDNLKEIQDSILEAMQKNDIEIFAKTCHKIRPTLNMLEDKELIESLDVVKLKFFDTMEKGKSISHFIFICSQIIHCLEEENF